MTAAGERDTLFMRAARGEQTSRAPIWFMRQAGRHLAEYRVLKEQYGFERMVHTPELAAEVTLQPVRRYKLDAAILFSDIMTPLASMGVEVRFNPGPVLAEPLRSERQVEGLIVPDAGEIAPFVMRTLGMVRKALANEAVSVIGFAGAPLTLATYLVEGSGSKNFEGFRAFLGAAPRVAHQLLAKLTEVTILYLGAQIEAGAEAVQLFDTWAGLHDEPTYRAFGLPYNTRVLKALEHFGVPRIFLAVGASQLQRAIAGLPCEVISVDWRMPLAEARSCFPGRSLQGNLDPAALFAPPEVLAVRAREVLLAGLGGGHIFNLGHGLFRDTAPDQVMRLVEAVRGFDREKENQGV